MTIVNSLNDNNKPFPVLFMILIIISGYNVFIPRVFDISGYNVFIP